MLISEPVSPAGKPGDDPDVLMRRGREVEKRGVEMVLVTLPWIAVLQPQGITTFGLVIVLNAASVYGIAAWVFSSTPRR